MPHFPWLLPPDLDPRSGLTWWSQVRKGYSYQRYLGYTYQKKRGKRKRVHHFKTVLVPALIAWHVYFPKPAAKKAALKKAEPWLKVPEYLSRLEKRLDYFVEVEDPLQHSKEVLQDQSWIRSSDKLLWEHRAPKPPSWVVVISVWLLLYFKQDDEYKIWSRSRSYGLRQMYWESQNRIPPHLRKPAIKSPDNYAETIALRDDLKNQFEEWVSKRHDYIEARGMVAWSYWNTLTKAPRKPGDNPNPVPG